MSRAYGELAEATERIEAEAASRLVDGSPEAAPMNVGTVLMLFEAQRFSDQPSAG